MSADRRFKVTFLAVVLAVLIGFGTWYGFVDKDGGAGEVAQDVIAQRGSSEEEPAPDATAQEAAKSAEPPGLDQAAQGGAPLSADSDADPLAAVEPKIIEQMPAGAVPATDMLAGDGVETGPQIAAVDPSADTQAALDSAAAAPPPVFDIVRVEPTGDAVIAGRTSPGAVVELVSNGVVHDRIVADASGAFAFVPKPFPVGTSEVVLRVVGADGAVRQSEQSVTIVVAADLVTAPMVAMAAPNQPTVVLSQPETPAAETAAAGESPAGGTPADRQQIAAADANAFPNGSDTIRIASVEAELGGGLYVTGEAAPNATVRLYLNDTFVAPAEAGPDGSVSFSIERGVRPGSYRVRLDQVAAETGTVMSRAEIVFDVPELLAEAPVVVPDATLSFEPAEKVVAEADATAVPERAASTTIPEISTAVVTRGDSLWRISRQVYGSGMRYTEIFVANQNQIRNPDLIYPGQLFVLPVDPALAEGEAAPAPGVN